MTKRWWASIALAVTMVMGVSACGGGEQASDDAPSDAGSSQASDGASGSASPGQGAPTPDLEGVPDVVATVNGEEIARDEFALAYKSQFQRASMQAQTSGKPVDQDKLKQQVAKNLVGSELLDQEASKRGFSASDKQVQQTLKDLAKQNQLGSVDKLFSALEQQGLKKKNVMEDVRTQVKVDQLLNDEAGNIKPTEKELRKLYEQAVAQQGQGSQQSQGSQQQTPSFKKVRPQLEQRVKQQKRNQVAQKLVKNLREQADVTINL